MTLLYTLWILILPLLQHSIPVTFAQDIPQQGHGSSSKAACNSTDCKLPAENSQSKSAPPGINDKVHDRNLTDKHPYGKNGPYWLVPPFFIGATTVIVVYIVGHCLYLHCYATKKMKKLAGRQYPPAIIINDDMSSSGSFAPYTPMFQYNEDGEVAEGQQFVFFQPFDDNEWERQLSLRRKSSVRSSFRSSFRKAFHRESSRKKRPSLKVPGTGNGEEQAPAEESSKPQRPRVCLLPVARSLSVPVQQDANKQQQQQQQQKQQQGFILQPVLLARTQSCKVRSQSVKRPVKRTSSTPKITNSQNEGESEPKTSPVILISSFDAAMRKERQDSDVAGPPITPKQRSPKNRPHSSKSSPKSSPVFTFPDTAEISSNMAATTIKPEVTSQNKMAADVLFHIGEEAEDDGKIEPHLCDIQEENES